MVYLPWCADARAGFGNSPKCYHFLRPEDQADVLRQEQVIDTPGRRSPPAATGSIRRVGRATGRQLIEPVRLFRPLPVIARDGIAQVPRSGDARRHMPGPLHFTITGRLSGKLGASSAVA